MGMLKSFLFSGLAVLVMADVAQSADVENVPAYDWTAFHIGAGVGVSLGSADDDSDISVVNSAFVLFSVLGEVGGDDQDVGPLGTLEVGQDLQIGSNFLIGVLANYDSGETKMHSDGQATLENDVSPGGGSVRSEWNVDQSWAVGGRVGFLVRDDVLVYAVGGYTEAKLGSAISFDVEGDNGILGADFEHESNEAWEDGWFAGAGVETLLTDHISLKGEYRFADFGNVKRSDQTGCFGSDQPDCIAVIDQSADITVQTLRAVLSWRFGL